MKIETNERSLNELKSKLKTKYPLLKDGDLIIKNNDTKIMLRIVAYKLRKSKEEMRDIVENL